MSTKWKIGIFVGIVAIVLAFIAYNQFSMAPTKPEGFVEISEVNAPEANG